MSISRMFILKILWKTFQLVCAFGNVLNSKRKFHNTIPESHRCITKYFQCSCIHKFWLAVVLNKTVWKKIWQDFLEIMVSHQRYYTSNSKPKPLLPLLSCYLTFSILLLYVLCSKRHLSLIHIWIMLYISLRFVYM